MQQKQRESFRRILRLSPTRQLRYIFAILVVIAAWMVALLLQIATPHLPLSIGFFVVAVAVSAGYGGIGPGILSTVLSAIICDYFFLPPIHSLLLTQNDLPLLLFFLLVAVCINLLGERLQRETRELAAVRDQLEALNSITAEMNASLELSTVLTTLKQQIVQYLKTPGGLLFLFDSTEELKPLRLAESWGWDNSKELRAPNQTDLTPSSLLSKERGEAGHDAHGRSRGEALSGILSNETWLTDILVQETQEQPLLPKTGQIAQFPSLQTQSALSLHGRDAYLIMPLVANGAVQGFLWLFDTAPNLFSKQDMAFFEALGRQAGVLIHNAQLYEQVRAGNAHLQHLSRQLVNVQEAERRAIARELHDEVGQLLTGLKLSLEMKTRLPAATAEANRHSSIQLVNELIARVRNLSIDLRPAMLDDLGLLPTLLWHFERYTASTGVNVHFEHGALERRFSYEIETTAYRIVQEALTNVARYAQTPDVTVRLLDAQDLLVIQVTDQGRGFDIEAVLARANTGGLTGMRERVGLVGGELTLESSPGKGTCLTAELPILEQEKA